MIKNLIFFVGLLLTASCSVTETDKKQSGNVGYGEKKKQSYEASIDNNNFELKIIPNLILNQKNYLIDFDGDGTNELISLEDSYSRRKFYEILLSKNEFKEVIVKSPLHRASFMKLNPRNGELGVFILFQNSFMPPGGGYPTKISSKMVLLS